LVKDNLGPFLVDIELAFRSHRQVTRNRALILLISFRPRDTLNRPLTILELKRRITLARLVILKLDRMYNTGQTNLAAVGSEAEIRGGQLANPAQLTFVPALSSD